MNIVNNNLLKGHRQRLRDRFKITPLRMLPDYELLEMLLFYTVPRSDTKVIAKKLLERYGSLMEIISSDPADLLKIDGFGDSSVFLIELIKDFFSRLYVPIAPKEFKVLSHWNDVMSYCQLTMGYRESEYFRVLYLNNKNALIEDHISSEGTIDQIQIYPREIIKKALSCNATAIILVHNHPTGDPRPSNEDISFTKQIINVLAPLNIVLHDHIIIARGKSFSFKAEGII